MYPKALDSAPFHQLYKLVKEEATENEVYKIELLMKQAKITTDDRHVTVAAKKRAEELGVPTAAIELSDGCIITSKIFSVHLQHCS